METGCKAETLWEALFEISLTAISGVLLLYKCFKIGRLVVLDERQLTCNCYYTLLNNLLENLPTTSLMNY